MAVSVPSYVQKAHGIIERLKGLLNTHNIVFSSAIIEGLVELPEDISNTCDYLMEKLANAAQRASISTEELIKRAEFVPASVKFEEDELETEMLASSEALVAELKALMTDEEWIISQGIMESKTYAEIAEELGMSDSAVYEKFGDLKKKILKRLEGES